MSELERYTKLSEDVDSTLIENALEPVISIDSEGRITSWNLQAERVFGWVKTEILGKLFADKIITLPHREDFNGRIVNFLETKDTSVISGKLQVIAIDKDEEELIIELTILPVKPKDSYNFFLFIRDITEQKLTREKLTESQRQFSSLLKNLPGIAYRIRKDPSYKAEFISDGCKMITGCEVSDFINNKISLADLIHPGDKERVKQIVSAALNEKLPFQLIYRIKSLDGSVRWVWDQGRGIYSSDGKPVYIEGFISDISEEREVEEELIQSEFKFRSLVEKSLVGVYIIQEGRFAYVNPIFASIFGYDNPAEIISTKKVEDLVYEEDRALVSGNLHLRLSGKVETLQYCFRGLKKNQEVIDVEVLGSITTYDEKPAVIGTLLDITARMRGEANLRKFMRAIEQTPASIIITDTRGNIEFVNPKFEEITGFKKEEILGKNPRILKSGDQGKDFYKKMWGTITSGHEWRGELINKKKNGDLFWELAIISPIKNNEGIITNFIAIKEDITESKKTAEELRTAKEKAEEMNRLKSIFLANMSHELRTPMVAILGYSEILKYEINSPDLKPMADDIYESSKRFLNTLNLILDLSKIEANKSQTNYIKINVGEIIKEELEIFKPLAKKKNILLKTKLPADQVICFLDERMLRQILNNLLSNAVKFTLNGEVTVKLKVTGQQNENLINIDVKDTGIGIPRDRHEFIFQEFRQVSEGFNRDYEGSGLGLTISKNFAKMMNGEITVKSSPGEGSIFTLKLPFISEMIQEKNAAESKITKDVKSSIGLPRILLVEDDSSNANVIKFFLQNVYSCDIVKNGENALEKVLEYKYDAVLMDIDLGPGMTGLETAQRIRELPRYKDTPVIAVTALAMRGDRERFLAEGCTHYISKPFNKQTLVNLIKEVLETAPGK